MPELPEVELYRRLAARAVGRTIVGVDAPDPWFLKGGIDSAGVASALVGRRIEAARRIGKVLLLDTAGGPTAALRFGMTGRLILDGLAGVDQLLYSSLRDEPAWDRFALDLDGGGRLAIRDPRRLGGVHLDLDEGSFGIEATALTAAGLARALGGCAAPLKARLMDQARIAGLGNLLTDEILWRARLDPARPAGTLSSVENRRLHRHIRATVDDLLARGGSHLGDLMASRAPGGLCPRDGAGLVRRTIGGRTTWSCPQCQS